MRCDEKNWQQLGLEHQASERGASEYLLSVDHFAWIWRMSN